MNRQLVLLGLWVGLAGIAQAGNKNALVVDEGQLGKTHMLLPGATVEAPGYPAAYVDDRDNVCIAIGYTVKADGTTGDFILLDTWSDASLRANADPGYFDAFAQAGAAAVSQWRFQPRDQAAVQPVRTVATLTFRGAGVLPDLADRCRVRDLAAHYRKSRAIRDQLVTSDVSRQSREAERQIQANEARLRRQAPLPPPSPSS
ncbi:MAG: hypothetical protein ABIQ62_07335 [Thermomonas sp.]